MSWDLSLPNLLGVAAGLGIIAVGTFVLVARPAAPLHRLFFLLALFDGLSTILYRASRMTDDPALGGVLYANYWYYFAGFIALVAAFGLLFPRPRWDRPSSWVACLVLGLAALAVMALHAWDREAIWQLRVEDGALRYPLEPAGNMVQTAFVVAVGIVIVKLTLDIRRSATESFRRQSAYVLGGMALAYAPYAWTYAAQAAVLSPRASFVSGDWDIVLSYWAFVGQALLMIASAVILLRERRPEAIDERRFVMGCYLAVGAMAVLASLFSSAFSIQLMRMAALLAYPILLGYAIVRYEVFDIDRKLRRAASVTFAAMGLTLAFVLVENAAENLLQQRVFAGIPSGWVSGSVAALVATAGFIPISRASRRAAAKLVPELSEDDLHVRKLEIYRHSVAGALADGILKEGESRTLAALRSSLGITDSEHASILREVAA